MWHNIFKKARPYLWLLPSFFLFVVFTFYPFLKTIYRSFFIVNRFGQVSAFVALENYQIILQDADFLLAIRNTLLYTLLTVPISKVLGYVLAFLACKRRKTSVFYETAFALPMALATSVIAMIFQLMYVVPLGILYGRFHIEIRWLSDAKYALLAVAIVQIWLSTGYAFVYMLSAVRSIPDELIESAQMDGASRLRQIFSIYIPLTTPTLFYLIVTDLAFSMMSMSVMNVLTGGGPNKSTMTIMLYIYQQFSKNGNYTTANAASVIAFLITMACTLLAFIWEKKGVHYQ